MRTIWIVVADAGRARILSKLEGIADLAIVQKLDNPAGRAHNVDLVTNQRGRSVSHSGMMSAMETPTEPHEHKAREFAHELNHVLEAAASSGEYDLLALVAPPHFLGLLRCGLKPAAKRRLGRCLPNDLTRLGLLELQSHLGDVVSFTDASAEQN